MNSICPMNFFRTTDTTDTTIWKPGFRVIKACCFAICSVRLSMLSSWAMDFACESLMLAASVLAFM